MLVVETIAKIRRAYFQDGKPIKQICRELRVSRNTVRRVIRSGATEFTYERRVQPQPRIGPWRDELDRMLAENARKPKRDRLTHIRIFEELRTLGYQGGYDAVRRYAVTWARSERAASAAAYVPLSFDPGEAYQFDWSHEIVVIDGVTTTGHAMNSENRQKTLAAMNNLWQGNPIRRTRAGDGHLTLYGRRLAVHLMVQPGVARNFFADSMAADTGFSARFLTCEPPSTIGRRKHADIRRDDPALAAFSRRLREILEIPMPMEAETQALEPRLLPLSPAARQLLVAFADDVEARQAPNGDLALVTGCASKAAEQAARIAGVMTLWSSLDASEVAEQTMADAIALARYYLGEAARLAEESIISPRFYRAERLRKWLVDVWPEEDVTLRDIMQGAPTRQLRDNPVARAAIAVLEHHGWLVRLERGAVVRGTKRREAWRIVRWHGGKS